MIDAAEIYKKGDTMFLKLCLIALPIFIAMDLLWIGVIAKNFYAKQIGPLLKSDINWIAAIAFYLIFISGIIFFVVRPAIEKGDWKQAWLMGAYFGLITYGTYDLTNLATLKDFSVTMTIIDMLWGCIIASTASVVTYAIATYVHGK